jgi:hypothetical protein
LVKELWKFCQNQLLKGKTCYFYKTDFNDFYGNIDHAVLLEKLAGRMDEVVLSLVKSAIETPTFSIKLSNQKVSKGVPQGLAISNILAEIYISATHYYLMGYYRDDLYLRYVDDILIMSTKNPFAKDVVDVAIKWGQVKVTTSDSKTKDGTLEAKEFDFLGYHISLDGVIPKKENRNAFADRVVRRCMQISRQYADSSLRPSFVADDKRFIEYASFDLNRIISGFRLHNRNYGWLAYFQQMTDISFLYQLDAVIRLKLPPDIWNKVNTFVDSYHSLKRNRGNIEAIDFDKETSYGERVALLKRFGYIRNDEDDISENDLDKLYNRLMSRFKKEDLEDRGPIS